VLTRVSNFAITQLVEDDEVHARQVIGHSALPTGSGLGFELVDQIDDVEDEVTGGAPIPTGLSPAARAAVDELREQARDVRRPLHARQMGGFGQLMARPV
jgi:hypothetical protein